jgi:hypothetical protein
LAPTVGPAAALAGAYSDGTFFINIFIQYNYNGL